MSIALLAILGACTEAAPTGASRTSGDPKPTKPPTSAEPIEAPRESTAHPPDGGDLAPRVATGSYALHEWGVIGVAIEGGAAEVATRPFVGKRRERPRVPKLPLINVTVDKPIVWAHLDEDVDELAFELSVEATGGRFVEHWPLIATEDPEPRVRLRWAATAKRGTCGFGTLPGVGDPACKGSFDGVCEVADLGALATDDAACLHVGDAPVNALFYRSSHAPASAALRDGDPTATGGQDVDSAALLGLHVRAEGTVAHIENLGIAAAGATVWRVYEDDQGRLYVGSVALAPVNQSVTIDRPTSDDVVPLARWLDDQLRTSGLTASERASFHRAWDYALFGTSVKRLFADDDTVVDILPPDTADESVADKSPPDDGLRPREYDGKRGGPGLSVSRDELLVFMDTAAVERLLPWHVSPQPRAVRRVMLVRVLLPTKG